MKSRKRYLILRYLRERLEIKQHDLAKLIGIVDSHYSKKENGAVRWGFDECELIRDYINERLIKKGESALYIDEIFKSEEALIKPRKPVK